MSELKAILATPHPKMKNACDGAIEVYPKYEADKVIAEKDAEIAELKERHKEEVDELQKATDSAWGKVNAMYDEILNHKYKRCLAMARWCKSMMVFNSKYGTDKKWHLFKKWRDRWLALAEEPTWAKFLQLIHKEEK